MSSLSNQLFREEYARNWVLENRNTPPVRGAAYDVIKAEMAQLEVSCEIRRPDYAKR
jgi:hypothetical protein